MKIKFWGSRGSISVSGPKFAKYGGDTACVEIRTRNDEVIIVDTGTGVRELGNSLIEERKKRIHIIYTHAHWDHIIGFPFFKPLYVPDTRIIISGCKFSQDSIKKFLTNVMDPPYFPVKLNEIEGTIHFAGTCQESISIDSIKIYPIHLNHPNNGIGFKFVEGDKTFVYLTDNEIGFKFPGGRDLSYKHPSGLEYKDYLEFSRGADLLVHDAEYTHEEYHKKRVGWGHSCSRDALELAVEAEVKLYGMFHLNQDKSDAEIDAMENECREILRNRKIQLDCFAIPQGFEIEL